MIIIIRKCNKISKEIRWSSNKFKIFRIKNTIQQKVINKKVFKVVLNKTSFNKIQYN